MKKFDLGQLVTILANVGVIAGIVFLAIELRQNNELMVEEARANRVNLRQADTTLVLENPELGRALIKHRNDEELTDHESLLVTLYIDFVLVNFQNEYLDTVRGLSDEDDLPVETWRLNFGLDRVPEGFVHMRDYWERNKDLGGWDEQFVRWMEENVVNPR